MLSEKNKELVEKLGSRDEQLVKFLPRKKSNGNKIASADIHKSKESRIRQEQLAQQVLKNAYE